MSNPKYQEIKRAMEQTPIDPIMERVIGDDPLAYQQEFSIGDVRTAVRLGYADEAGDGPFAYQAAHPIS